jgi:hypothetical protein
MTNTIGFDMDGGMFPRLWCAGCGEMIELAKTGIDSEAKVIWNKKGDVVFMHQNCDDESYQFWEPLESFFRHLLHNTRLTKKLKQKDLFEEAFGCASKPRKKVRTA